MKKGFFFVLLASISVILAGQHNYIKNDTMMVVVELIYGDVHSRSVSSTTESIFNI